MVDDTHDDLGPTFQESVFDTPIEESMSEMNSTNQDAIEEQMKQQNQFNQKTLDKPDIESCDSESEH